MRSKRGFTLIEMMIVVAIIALLSTIAIPNYIKFQLRAKTAEAKLNLGSIRTCEEAYRVENDTYLDCQTNPSSVPSGSKDPWETGRTGWSGIGFEPRGDVYYQYEVSGSSISGFTAFARSDLDGEGDTNSIWSLDQDGNLGSSNPLE